MRTKIDNRKIYHRPIFPFIWNFSSISKDRFNEWEFCNHDSKHFSILSLSANPLCDFHAGIVDSFIFSLTRHLTRSLRSLSSYQFKQPKKNSISTRAIMARIFLLQQLNSRMTQKAKIISLDWSGWYFKFISWTNLLH